MAYKTIEFALENSVGVLTINRPEALNALNEEVINEVGEFLSSLDLESVRVLIVTGVGKSFVAGADIKAFKDMSVEGAKQLAEKGQALFSQIEELPIPVIAAVNGFALGGGLELALACDFIIASRKAKLGLPEVSLGLIPGYGGTQRLARNIGKAKAKAITLSGDIFSAQQFLDWGLIVEVVEPDDLMNSVQSWANKIITRGPRAMALAKKAIEQGFDKDFKEALSLEAEYFADCFKTEDQKEGVNAFLEKRTPTFTGK